MSNLLRKGLMLGLMLAIAGVCTVREAAALSYKDIAGKWCTEGMSYVFSRDALVVEHYADKSRRNFKVDGYEFAGGTVTVRWIRADGETTYTTFAEFSADDRMMVQPPTRNGPRREFRRCQ